MNRRNAILSSAAVFGAASLLKEQRTAAAPPTPKPPVAPPTPASSLGFTPVVTPNGVSLAPTMKDGVKEFRLVAEVIEREIAPGMTIHAWGYNGVTPGPTLEAVEGDRIRVFVTNKLPERTSLHLHGVLLPNGMDGVAGLNQPHILPGETFVYELTLRQHGVQMYHPHSDEMVQMAMGMMGFFVIHPKVPTPVDRHFVVMLHEWFVAPGTKTPNPNIMLDFNLFTFNSSAWPGTDPFVVKTGDRVRMSFGNLSMDSHPIHLHGYRFRHAATDGGDIPEAGRVPMTTINVPVGSTQTVEFIADAPGDWALHCHKSHHTMNAMNHDAPNLMGVKLGEADEKLRKVLPSAMVMGTTGMAGMSEMGAAMGTEPVENTLPMSTGTGPFGAIEMGGMFTVLKVRDGITSYADPGWYAAPAGTVARKVVT